MANNRQRQKVKSKKQQSVKQQSDEQQQAANEKTDYNEQAKAYKARMDGTAKLGMNLLGKPMMLAAKFEKSMSRLQALANPTAQEFAKLTQAAQQLGQGAQFGPTEIAAGMEQMAQTGWKGNEIMAAMPNILNFATVGQLDLAKASDVVANVMSSFGIEAGQSARITDVLSAAAKQSKGSIAMLSETMQTAGPVAASFGLSLEDTTAIAGMMANAGIKADQAGSAISSSLLRLADPKAQAEMMLDSLGISFEDASGSMKPMGSIVKETSAALQNLSESERTAAAQRIFGTEAAKAWLAVIDQGPEALDELTGKLLNSGGAAQEMAAIMNNNASGAFQQLETAIESIRISVGNALLPAFTTIASTAAECLGKVAAFAAEHPVLTQYIAGTAAVLIGLAAGLAGVGYVASLIGGGITAIATLFRMVQGSTQLAAAAQWLFNTSLLGCPVVWIIAGIAALIGAGYLLYQNWATVSNFLATFLDHPAVAIGLFLTGPVGWLIGSALLLITHWTDVCNWFTLLWNDPSAALQEFIGMIQDKFGAAFAWLEEKVAGIKSMFSGFSLSSVSLLDIPQLSFIAHARGGFITSPHLGLVGEAGPEAIIPLDGSMRAMSLWQQTGQQLGAFDSVPPMRSSLAITGGASAGSSVHVSAPIHINISGNADNQTVQQLQQAVQGAVFDLKRQLENLHSEQRRVSYA